MANVVNQNFQVDVCESGVEIQKVANIAMLDDDGKPTRKGNVWTASAHIITAIIGSGVLSLAWAVAQLGWIAGITTLVVFSGITFYTSNLLSDCYRSPVTGKRNYTYMEAVKNNLGGRMYMACGMVQYANLCGMIIGYTITASISMAAIQKSDCFHKRGHEAPCRVSHNPYMIALGIFEIFLSQIPNFHKLSMLSVVAAIMSFGYSSIGVGLAFAKVISGQGKRTNLSGVEVGISLSAAEKTWRMFRALGDIAFAYTYSQILIEIQDTLKAIPPENQVMKKANFMAVSTTTLFYMMCGCLGYAAFGNNAPGNLLTGFGFYEPFWLVDLANCFIVVHLVGAYQVWATVTKTIVEGYHEYTQTIATKSKWSRHLINIDCDGATFADTPLCNLNLVTTCETNHTAAAALRVFSQPIFSAVELWASKKWPKSKFITKEYFINIGIVKKHKLRINLLRMIWRTLFVIMATLLAMVLPFFNDILALLGALGYWPLTVYFPIQMYIAKGKIRKCSWRWLVLQVINLVCLLVALAAACGSIQGLNKALNTYKPFEVNE